MSFRLNNRMRRGVFSPVFVTQMVKDSDSGVLVPKSLCSSESVLPDSDLFELENLLEAKIPLTQINSKLVGGSSMNLDKLAKSKAPKTETKTETKTKTTSEVTNE